VAVLTVDGNEPGPTPIQVPQEDGTVVHKPFAECSMEELKRAIKHKRTPPKPLPENATSRLETYRSVLDQHLSERHSIQVSARVERDKVLISVSRRSCPGRTSALGVVPLGGDGIGIDEPTVAGAAAGAKPPAGAQRAWRPGSGCRPAWATRL
ncbi:MAG TPA: hypothetical protein VEZ71_02945, partial [Archangium sp.]|nr:hypothetical protein [Archangium sp.]